MRLTRRLRHTSGIDNSPLRILALIIAICLVGSCGGDNGDGLPATNPFAPAMEVESGSFDVVAKVSFNACNSTKDYSGTYNITFTDTSFTMAGWSGDWNATPSQLKADGESAHTMMETRGCTIRTWTEVHLTFTSNDSFYGNITYRKRVSGTCDCCPRCTSSWTFNGTRVTN